MNSSVTAGFIINSLTDSTKINYIILVNHYDPTMHNDVCVISTPTINNHCVYVVLVNIIIIFSSVLSTPSILSKLCGAIFNW